MLIALGVGVSSTAIADPSIFGAVSVMATLKTLALNVAWLIIPMLFAIKFFASLHKILKREKLNMLDFIFGKDLIGRSIEPPAAKNQLIDSTHIAAFYNNDAFGGNDYLKKYPSIKQRRDDIKKMASSIKQSNMTVFQKESATTLSDLSDKAIATLRELHHLGKVSADNQSTIIMKLDEVKSRLAVLVDNHSSLVASGLGDIKIPDTFQKQERLEQLRLEGKRLLSKIEGDPNFDGVEDKFRLGVIIEKRLDEVWNEYTAAKSSYYDDSQEGIFTITNSKKTTPDAIIDMIFDDVANIYKDIGAGVKSTKKAKDLGDLLASKSYFERR